MEVITNVRGIQGKPFQYDYVCEIFSKIFFGILDICLIAVFIVTVLTVAELKITKMWKLCCFTITFIFLMAAVVFSTNIWIFIRTSDIYDVSFHVVMIPANLINCMLITTGKGYYVKLLNQMAKDRLKSESEENSHTCCTLLQKTDYKVQLEPVQKSKESTNL
ncbi:uncharacterized protein LOC143074861 [Mytilus galloprovincialis]|uniref:uncharacterized protein LOC143074861 n=1 Tax=Mytilus galloprovincialis TaxID=29158 RepID=UPI003F7BD427